MAATTPLFAATVAVLLAVLATVPPPALTLAVPLPTAGPCTAATPPPMLPGDADPSGHLAVAAQLVARFQQRADIRVSNATTLAAKLAAFVGGGREKLAVISDWDRTITKGSSLSSHSVVHSYHGAGSLTRACTGRMHNTSAHYLKIEQSAGLSTAEKLPFMVEWYGKNHQAFVDCHVTKGMLRAATVAALGNGSLVLREGAAAAMEMAAEADVPFLVFSAGLADVIEMALADDGGLADDGVADGGATGGGGLAGGGGALRSTIVSNRMLWSGAGDDARLAGFSSPLIHMFNKDQSQVRLTDQPGVHRPHALVLGDGLGDAMMVDGAAHPPSQVLRVGFLNYQNFAPHLADYLEVFDLVLLHDMSMAPVHDIIRAVVAAASPPPHDPAPSLRLVRPAAVARRALAASLPDRATPPAAAAA